MCLDDIVHDIDGQPLQKRNAFAQRRLEGDLAAHGAFGDRGDMGFDADVIGQFVDAFLADHGGIHIGEEQPLAAMCERLQDHIDEAVPER